MSGAPVISGMMLFFTLTTIGVIAYPLIKLTPSWLEGRVHRRIAFHRDAITALGFAIDRVGHDSAQRDRLMAQHTWHRAALANLAPGEVPVAAAPAASIDEAA